MIFGKRNSVESVEKSNNLPSRSTPVPIRDKKADETSSNQDTSSTTISRLLPIQSDNIPMNLITRFDATVSNQLTTINKMQTVVRL
jgi:hypothetical protein